MRFPQVLTNFFGLYTCHLSLISLVILGSSILSLTVGAQAIEPYSLELRSQSLRQKIGHHEQATHNTWPQIKRTQGTQANTWQSNVKYTTATGQLAPHPVIQQQYSKHELSITSHLQTKAIDIQLSAQYRNNHFTQDDQALTFDHSYAAYSIDYTNPTSGTAIATRFGIGSIDRWWGPTWESALILSNNARPIPGLFFDAQSSGAIRTPILNWLGPWSFNTFIGRLESDRDFSNPLFFGARLALAPLRGLEIGLSRTALFGGGDRSASLKTFGKLLLGQDNQADAQPGNQLGAVDISYAFGSKRLGTEVYLEIAGEDEAGGFPAKKFGTLGMAGFYTPAQLAGGSAIHWLFEFANTTAGGLEGNDLPNITYEHHIYTSGYNHYDRSIGAPYGGDIQNFTLATWLVDNQGSSLESSTTGIWLSDIKGQTNPQIDFQRLAVWRKQGCLQAECQLVVDYLDQKSSAGTNMQINQGFGVHLSLSVPF